MNQMGVRPSFATGFAQWPGMSEHPELWRGLVGFWPFFLGQTGNKVFDLSGNGIVGTFGAGAASPSWIAGKYGSAISYDGGDYIDTGVTSLLGTSLFCDSSQKFSVVVSFNLASGVSGTLIAKAGGTAGNRTFQFYTVGGDIPLIYLRGFNNEGGLNFIGGTIADGKNHIVVITWDGATARYYLDGLYLDDLEVGAASEETTENIIFGARTGGTGYFLTGIEDFVSIYNRALSASEIAFLSGNPTALVQLRRRAVIVSVGIEAPPVGIPIFRRRRVG